MAFLKMTFVEVKLFLREPAAVFFTLAFPLVLLAVFGTIYGNEPLPFIDGYGTVDLSVPGYIGMMIGALGLIGLPVALATYREHGFLRRLQATPVRPRTILSAQVAVAVVMVLVGTGLLMAAGRFFFDLRLPAFPLALVPAMALSCLSFCALSFVLAAVLPTPRTAQSVGMALLFPMLFLSGAAMPRQMLPDVMQRLGDFLPLTHVVTVLQDLWLGHGWNMTALLVLAGMLVAGGLLSAYTFRWQ